MADVKFFSAYPVATPAQFGDTVALAMDTKRPATIGPELIVNGGHESGLLGTRSDGGGSASTWTLNTTAPISGAQDGQLVITTSATNNPRLDIGAISGVLQGRLYEFSFDYKVNSGTAIIARIHDGGGERTVGSSLTGSGTFTIRLVCLGANIARYIDFGNSVCDVQLDNFSVREIVGINPAYQLTSAHQPVIGRLPVGGRRNLLIGTDVLSTQSRTVAAAQHTLSFRGTGTVTLSGASTSGPLVGTGEDDIVSLTFTPSAGSLTLTVSGTVEVAQLELGADRTGYQSVVTAHDITEEGVASYPITIFDGVDDRWNHRFGEGFNGDVLVCGRKGSWIAEGVSVAANGDLTIGPTTFGNAPIGILPVLGPIVGYAALGRTMTTNERNRVIDYYGRFGAKDILQLGPELLVNGDFSDGDAGWDLGPGWSISDGQAILTNAENTADRLIYEGGFSVDSLDKRYLLSINIISATSSVVFSPSRIVDISFSGTGVKTGVAVPSITGAGSFAFLMAGSHSCVIDSISFRQIIL